MQGASGGVKPNEVARVVARMHGPSALGVSRLALMMPNLPMFLLNTVERWEARNSWNEHDGRELEPAPFDRTVMNFLARFNKLRVEKQREEASRQRKLHTEAARQAANRSTLRPKVSRRVLNERRKRTAEQIESRRAAKNQDSGPTAKRGGLKATIEPGPDTARAAGFTPTVVITD